MRKKEYTLPSPIDCTIAIVADLHEFNPEPVLEILCEAKPDVIAVPGDLFENHEFGENLDMGTKATIMPGSAPGRERAPNALPGVFGRKR